MHNIMMAILAANTLSYLDSNDLLLSGFKEYKMNRETKKCS